MPSQGSSAPRCKICKISNGRKKGRECFNCNNYFHLSCVKLSQKASSSLSCWKCLTCLSLPSSELSSVSSSLPSGFQTASSSASSTTSSVISPPSDLSDVSFPTEAPEVLQRLSSLRSSRNIVKFIPKSVRVLAATALSSAIDDALVYDSSNSWNRLLFFAPAALGVASSKSSSSSLSSRLRQQISSYIDDKSFFKTISPLSAKAHSSSSFSESDRLRFRVNSKLNEGDVHAAVQVLSSDDTLASPTEEVIESLKLKHPPSPVDLRPAPHLRLADLQLVLIAF